MEHSVYKAYQRARLENESHGATGPPSYMKLFFFGAPRSGKTATRRQLMPEIFNTISSTSTGVAETGDVVIEIVRRRRFELTLLVLPDRCHKILGTP